MSETKLDDCILEFAKRMQYKLDKNKHKECNTMNPDGKGRGWSHCKIEWLIKRARQEMCELEDAFYDVTNTERKEEIMNECADVANFAMMIFDNLTPTGKEE